MEEKDLHCWDLLREQESANNGNKAQVSRLYTRPETNIATAEASVHQASAMAVKSSREKQKREEFEVRLEHGFGKTDSEYPETFEQDQEKERSWSEEIDSVMFERQIAVKGSLSIPEKNPAVDMLVPTTFFRVICWITGRASGSYWSSGWLLELPVNQNASCTFSISTFDMTMLVTKPPRPGAVSKLMPVKELSMWRCSAYICEIPPDISLPKASPEPNGACKWTFLIWILVEGLSNAIP